MAFSVKIIAHKCVFTYKHSKTQRLTFAHVFCRYFRPGDFNFRIMPF